MLLSAGFMTVSATGASGLTGGVVGLGLAAASSASSLAARSLILLPAAVMSFNG